LRLWDVEGVLQDIFEEADPDDIACIKAAIQKQKAEKKPEKQQTYLAELLEEVLNELDGEQIDKV
jgi:hypothetical protein